MSAENFYDKSHAANIVYLRENFEQRPALNAVLDFAAVDQAAHVAATAANKNFEVAGTNATSALVTHSADGGLTLTTAGASADQILIQPQTNTSQSLWAVAGLFTASVRARFTALIKTGASIAATTIIAGFKKTNTPVIATDDDQVYLRYEPSENSGKWQIIHSRAGTDSTTVSTVTVAASTSYLIDIVIDADRKVNVFINGVCQTPVKLPALTAAVNLYPFVGIQAGAAAAKTMDYRFLECARYSA